MWRFLKTECAKAVVGLEYIWGDGESWKFCNE
jgi:hypothetical protein